MHLQRLFSIKRFNSIVNTISIIPQSRVSALDLGKASYSRPPPGVAHTNPPEPIPPLGRFG